MRSAKRAFLQCEGYVGTGIVFTPIRFVLDSKVPVIGQNETTTVSYVICPYIVEEIVKMEHAVYFSIGYANGKFAGSIWLPCAAEFPLSHFG